MFPSTKSKVQYNQFLYYTTQSNIMKIDAQPLSHHYSLRRSSTFLPHIHYLRFVEKLANLKWKSQYIKHQILLTNRQQGKYTISPKKIIRQLFKEKKTTSSRCSTIIKSSQSYYNCIQCQATCFSCICHECFINGNHEGHRFIKYKVKSQEHQHAVCDCGNINAWKKQGFCKHHHEEKIDIKIEQKVREIFSDVVMDLFSIYFLIVQQHPNQIFTFDFKQELFHELTRLNTSSLYYNKLTSQVLLSQVGYAQAKSQSSSKTILQMIFIQNPKNFDNNQYCLLIRVATLEEFLYKLTQQFMLLYNSPFIRFKSAHSDSLFTQLMTNSDILQNLAQKQGLILVPTEINKLYFSHDMKIMVANTTKCPKIYWLTVINKGLIRNHYSMMKLAIESIVKQFKDDKQVLRKILKDLLYAKQEPLDQDITVSKRQQKRVTDEYLIRSVKTKLVHNIFLFLIDQFPTTRNIQQEIQILNLEPRIWKDFVWKRFKKCFEKLKNKSKSGFSQLQMIVIIIECVFTPTERIELAQTIWAPLLNEKVKGLKNYKTIVKTVVQIIKALLNQSQILLIMRQLDFSFSKLHQRQVQYLKRVLSHKPGVSKQQMKQIVKQIGQNKIVGEFLSQNTRYTDNFYKYVGPVIDNLNPFFSISVNIGITEQSIIQIDPQKIVGLQILLPSSVLSCLINNILPYLKAKTVQNPSQQAQGTSPKQQVLKNYFTFLLLIAKTTNNLSLKQQISKLDFSRDQKNPLIKQILKDTRLIRVSSEFFHFDVTALQQNTKQDSIIPQINTKQHKFDKKDIKEKKWKEFRQRMNKISNFTQQKYEADLVHAKQCMICKDQQTDDNPLFSCAYLGKNHFLKEKMLSYRYDLIFKVCFHQVHFDCISKHFKDKMYYKCPGCNNISNCIVPTRINERSEQSLNILMKPESHWIQRLQKFSYREVPNLYQNSIIEIFFQYLIYDRSVLKLIPNLKAQSAKTSQLVSLLINTFIKRQMDSEKKELSKRNLNAMKLEIQQPTLYSSIRNFVVDTLLLEFFNQGNLKLIIQSIKLPLSPLVIRQILNQQTTQTIQHYMNSPINTQAQSIDTYREHISFKSIPQNNQLFLKELNLKCPNCNIIQNSSWQCLLCHKISCSKCLDIGSHQSQAHKYSGIFIQNRNAQIILLSPLGKYRQRLYRNSLQKLWNPQQQFKHGIKQFYLRKKLVQEWQNLFIYNCALQNWDREEIIQLLNIQSVL